ncbi:MAG TPA: GyrI-like domain-containing protein [Flavobacteriales bacterium]|jgi:effector-binding domain-containing protein|nr:GyrI-like domain-containing protein [Flavobacteriales bacterium]
MIDKPELTRTEAQQTASIHMTVRGVDMPKFMGPAIQELMDTLKAQGITPTGPMYSYHHRMPSDTFDFEVGVPVGQAVKPEGRVRPSQLPAAKVLRTMYHGPYEGLSDGWSAFMAQVKASGHQPQDSFWEFYVSGPESSPDPKNWMTELNRPLVG